LLGFGEKDVLIQNLQDRSGDKDGEFRLEIAGCLASSRDPECISAILPLLKEHDNQVSTRIALGIQLDDQSRLIDILKEILLDRENSDEVHWIATERLGKIDDRSAADILFSTFEYYPQDSGIHWRTIKSFESRKDPHLIEALIRFLENAEARMADMDKGRISALRSQLQVIDHQLHEISTQISSKLPALKLENGEYIEDKMKKLGIKPDPEVISLRNSMAPLAAEKFKIEQEISRLSRVKSNPVFFSYSAEDTALKLLQSLTHQGFIKSEDWRRWKESS
jgi:hypothetical protein